jgi:hypothetical protein
MKMHQSNSWSRRIALALPVVVAALVIVAFIRYT